jgi:hypothetical protein
MSSVLSAPSDRQPRFVPGENLQGLRKLIESNRRRWKGLVALEAVGLAVAAPLGYFWLVMLLDQLVHLPLVGRFLASLGLLAGIAWAVRHLKRRWQAMHFSEDQVALAMEQRTPGGVQNRLINAVQIARRPDPAALDLSEAVIKENVRLLQMYHLEQAGQQRPALIRLGLALAVIAWGLGMWLWHPDQFSNAAARILLPLTSIDPYYRTTLVVEPGNAEMAGDVPLKITIHGEKPKSLILYRTVEGKRSSEVIPVDARQEDVAYLMKDVLRDTDYVVRGGDFTSPTYRITVPRKAGFARLRVTYQYPAYTNLPSKTLDSATGDLEALQGTRARLIFLFDQPMDQVKLVPDRPRANKSNLEPLTLDKAEDGTLSGEIVLEDLVGYNLEVTPAGRKTQRLGPYAVRLVKDQEPRLELSGLERRMEVPIETRLPVRVQATDDFGLEQVGLFFRRISGEAAGEEEAWEQIVVWSPQKQTKLYQEFELNLATLPLTEGEKIEVTVRGKDTNPRNTAWTIGPVFELTLGGEGAALQIQYEQILRSEKELQALIRAEEEMLEKTTTWLRKLDGGADLRWDDPKNIAMLHAAVKSLRDEQEKLGLTTGKVARGMIAQTGNLRMGLGMLADTEMARLLRIFEAVPNRDNPQTKQAALADARVTLERIGRSLQEISEQYVSFRADWELANMIPFTKMLSERQAKLRDQSRVLASAKATEESQRPGQQRRQTKMLDLVKLIQPAFVGLAERLEDQEKIMASAFAEGGKTLASTPLHQAMTQAAEHAGVGRWSDASDRQTLAAEQLQGVYQRLRQAQVETAQKVLAALKEKAKSDLEAQKELENLPPGQAEQMVKDFPENLKLEDLIRLREVAGAKKRKDKDNKDLDFKDALLTDLDPKRITLEKDSGVRQDPNTLTLGKVAEKTKVLDMWKSTKEEMNKVKPFIQDKFEDLVGKLLDEAEELGKDYQSIKMSTNQNNNDPGDISKNGGALSSTGAVAATGNKKPPTTEGGGVSKTGFQGARAFGMVADSEGVDRRGRDKALDGMEQAPDQAGTIKNKKSDDPQKDHSTGIGGKKVESDDNHFSLHDSGKWKDDMVKRMDKPQAKNYLVERQGDKLDPKIAAQLRDMESKQEQVIERLKSIKKELKNLYLPTDHLDELAANLQSNLERLRERPDPELFRLQMHTLDRLRGAVRVFRTASSNFQPSLPRERLIRGRVLDEPTAPTLPGYEEAVKDYYLRLADQ